MEYLRASHLHIFISRDSQNRKQWSIVIDLLFITKATIEYFHILPDNSTYQNSPKVLLLRHGENLIMKQRDFFLTFISLIICFIFLSSISDIAYSQGYESEIVFQTQKNLQELGYNPGPIDGIWGKKTQSTLKKFQHDNGLSMTGKLDSKTKEKLGIISLEKILLERSIPVISIQESIRAALEHAWEIKKVQIENHKLTVVSNFNVINKQEYASMILEICRYANVSNQLKEIWILNVSQNQGWVLIRAEKCNQLVLAPLNQVDKLISSYSADVFIFESK